MTDILAAFRDADLGDLPSVSAMRDERAQVLWVLAAADKSGDPILTPAEISAVLTDVYKIGVSRQKAMAILQAERRTVVRSRKSGARAYRMMQAGLDEVLGADTTTVVFVEPELALSKIRETEEILASLTGTLSVCDPYVDGRTLDFLAVCTRAPTIRLLTINVNKPNPFKRDLTAFSREHDGKLEVRIASERDLHDRYIVHKDGLLLFGTSLNSVGKKQSFVVTLGPDLRADVAAAFDERWSNARAFG